MVVVIEKKYDRRKINRQIRDMKPAKVFDPTRFAGKIQWDEEPLVFQKRIRDEWN
ncbi:MAG: hypothetical protein LBT42_06230 [Tannerella sp.]|jgi:hypothetical protein|nr:hypothetical protein [Tannerella sp.]